MSFQASAFQSSGFQIANQTAVVIILVPITMGSTSVQSGAVPILEVSFWNIVQDPSMSWVTVSDPTLLWIEVPQTANSWSDVSDSTNNWVVVPDVNNTWN